MKWLYLVCRILLGALFVFAGVMKIHPFGPQDMHMPAPAMQWFGVMISSGWIVVLGYFEVLGGLLLLIGGTLPLGLCIVCPITVNILLFDILLAGRQGIGAALVLVAFEVVLIYGYRGSFAGILSYKAKPTLSSSAAS